MSWSSAFGYTNTTASQHDVTPTNIGLASNYSKPTVEQGKVVFDNKTAPTGQPETLTIKSVPIQSVNTTLKNRNPGKVADGVQYTATLETFLRTTNSDDAGYKLDEPIVVSLQIRHPASDYITNAHITAQVNRLIGGLQDASGNYIFGDLMRQDVDPTN